MWFDLPLLPLSNIPMWYGWSLLVNVMVMLNTEGKSKTGRRNSKAQGWSIHLGVGDGRRACKNDGSDPKETKTCQAVRSTPRSGLETYLVTFTVLYLLIWFALFDWTFHFKNLEIKDNTSKFHFKHLLASSYPQKQKHSKCTITSLPKQHFSSHLLLF